MTGAIYGTGYVYTHLEHLISPLVFLVFDTVLSSVIFDTCISNCHHFPLVCAICGAGRAYPTGVPDVTSRFLRRFMLFLSCILVCFLISFDIELVFAFWF